jgi:hypothetical protein
MNFLGCKAGCLNKNTKIKNFLGCKAGCLNKNTKIKNFFGVQSRVWGAVNLLN